MNTLEFICRKWNLSLKKASPTMPIAIPNASRGLDLPELFREAGFRVGAEIGVECGLYSEVLCRLIPGLKLYAVDCWKEHQGYRTHVSQKQLDGFYQEALERVKPYDCTLIREWSVEASKQFEDGSLDFVYIDAGHDFANVVKDIAAWLPKIRKGGIISGHDYRMRKSKTSKQHVVQAVKAWTDCYQVSPWFILGRREKIPGERRDSNRSWMWVVD